MTTAALKSRNRADIPEEYTWNLADIYQDWETWEADRARLDAQIDDYAALKGTLGKGAGQLLAAFKLSDTMGRLAHTVYYFPSLKYDEDQRNNDINARRQTVESLLARWQQARQQRHAGPHHSAAHAAAVATPDADDPDAGLVDGNTRAPGAPRRRRRRRRRRGRGPVGGNVA